VVRHNQRVKIMTDLKQAEFKVAYAKIIKGWSIDKMGKLPTLEQFNQAASLGHAHQSNNTVIGAMGLRPEGFTRAQMLAYCPPCLNSRDVDITKGYITEVTLPKVGGKRVYHQRFVKAKVTVKKVAKPKVAKPKGKASTKPKGKGKGKVAKPKGKVATK
jgi:hypothetical protein